MLKKEGSQGFWEGFWSIIKLLSIIFKMVGIFKKSKIKKRMAKLDPEMIYKYLEGVTRSVSKELGIPQGNLRSNIFTLHKDGYLRIHKGLHFNMNNPYELTIKIPVGYGCTGNAFQNRELTIAVLQKDWGKYILDDIEIKKVNKDLVWIVSVPIPHPKRPNEVIGILNIDCLRIRKTQTDLEKISDDMVYWVGLIAPQLKRTICREEDNHET